MCGILPLVGHNTYIHVRSGKRPRKARRDDLPKPTELMKQREGPLELEKNLNKTMVVQNPGGRGPGQPGFYCEPCNRTYKDSVGYLDHINGRARTCNPSIILYILLADMHISSQTCGLSVKRHEYNCQLWSKFERE